MDVVAAGDAAERLAAIASLDRFAPLMRGELRFVYVLGADADLARIIHEALEAAVLQRDRRAVLRGVGDAVVGV